MPLHITGLVKDCKQCQKHLQELQMLYGVFQLSEDHPKVQAALENYNQHQQAHTVEEEINQCPNQPADSPQ